MRAPLSSLFKSCVFLLLLAGAMVCVADSQGMVANSRRVIFDTPTRVGDVVLPVGEYQVRHSMEGENHIMTFRQMHVARGAKPAEARVKCTLVPLPEKARTTKMFLNDAGPGQKNLVQLIFEGDSAKHVF